MWWVFIFLACSLGGTVSLGDEGRAARERLAQSLLQRDPALVAEAARAAGPWEGKDPALDRLLGDALANVLMRPELGLQLLRAHPAPESPEWQRATLDAAARTGHGSTIAEVWAELGRAPMNTTHPVVAQVAQRMRQDPSLGHALLEDVVGRCTLLDAQPTVGRQALDLPASSDLVLAARALGASGIALGRAARRTDPDPAAGAGPWHCGRRVLLETAWPEPMVRSLVIAAQDSETALYLDIKMADGAPWAYAANDAQAGARWLKAAALYREAGGGDAGAAKIVAALGRGLAGQ